MWNLSLFNQVGVEYHTCNENQLILLDEEEMIETDFFNLLFYDVSKRKIACSYLEKQEHLTIVEEPKSENGVYLFVDGKLFQEIAIENKWARVNMHYEGYLYDLSQEERIVHAHVSQPIYENASLSILTFLLLFLVLCVGITSKL